MAGKSSIGSLSPLSTAPDLSHLTDEERKIIESVMMRQKKEEAKEAEVLKKKQDEVLALESMIRKRNDEKKKLGLELDATCQICMKTKFADGVGHVCNYCEVRCCARCGGKVTLRSNKVIWVCILCRKKQELLIKTGQWMHSSMASKLRQLEAEGNGEETFDKKPRLERGFSADQQKLSYHEVFGRRGSVGLPSRPMQSRELRRQYSQEAPRQVHDSRRDPWNESIARFPCDTDLPSERALPSLPHTQRFMPEIPSEKVFRRTKQLVEPTSSPFVGSTRSVDAMTSDPRTQKFIEPQPNWDLGDNSCKQMREGFPLTQYSKQLPVTPLQTEISGNVAIVPSKLTELVDNRSRDVKRQLFSSNGYPRKSHLDPNSALAVTSDRYRILPNGASRRTAGDTVLRNDSLSSDQSENVRPSPPKPHKLRVKGKKPQQQFSLSSSEEELRSTPEFSTEEDFENLSEKYVKCQRTLKREEILDAKIKRFLAHPITWKPSHDGSKLIGHMILKKNLSEEAGSGSSAAILGLKVIGGRITESGRLGAVIEKVKKGSIADNVGRLRPGDEVMEWNGRSLQGKTYEEVYDIIAESKQEPQVELIVSRPIRKTALPAEASRVFQEEQFMSRTRISRRHTDVNIPGNRYPKNETFFRQTSLGAQLPRSRVRISRSSTISGRLQVKLWYDIQTLQLLVTVISAVELPPRSNGQSRNTFCKILLLPDKSDKSKRRTRTIAATNEPKWNQTFVYSPLRRSDLKTKALEVTLWDYDRFGMNEFLGEVFIELATAPLDDEGEWYLLETHEETVAQLVRTNSKSIFSTNYINQQQQQKLYLLPSDHLSPPSTISRLSDSDLSELDYIDYDSELGLNTSRESWHGLLADTSQSSFGSNSSPPLLMDDQRRRSAGRSFDYYQYSQPGYYGSNGRSKSRLLDVASSSLPSRFDAVIYNRMRPEFRKSNSQPSRSLSPPSLRPHSPSVGNIFLSKPVAESPTAPSSKKRQLPQIPLIRRSSRERDQMTLNLEGKARHWKTSLQQRRSTEAMTPVGMYSDSEINTRPVYDRLFYAHPHQRHSSHIRGRGGRERRSSVLYSPDVSDSEHVKERFSSRRPSIRQGSLERKESKEKQRERSGSRSNQPKPAAGGESGEESESSSKISVTSAFSTLSERPKGVRTLGQFTSRMQSYGPVHPPRASASDEKGAQETPDEKQDDDISVTTATGGRTEGDKSSIGSPDKARSETGTGTTSGTKTNKQSSSSGALTKAKSSSTSQLSVSGTKKRLGFRRKQATSFSVHRSEEVAPEEIKHLVKQGSSVSSDGEGSLSGESSATWVPLRLAPEGEVSNFVDGLGPGQLVGRQALASPNLGDIQLSVCDRKGNLEVEVIRARGLQPKPGAKILPAPYVKVYLVKNRKCIAKAKTSTARRTLDPLYQQQLVFHEDYRGCVLQVTIWGDYGRIEKKVFMGVVQIVLDDLDLSNIVIGWFKLFHPSSLISLPAGQSRNTLMASDSFC
ncbi:regulating synaptic membrane exocytosis protein 2-like protein [Leptotrombidium deliense]|uniref:Regulating synaptic membrane exocytosis protein 2-like protein n=1 Tax=Leptotrombidium deliense TaxID=299467 RepID=A0A443SRZ2_9ACAR|nr:regulating synaptic membrane exocytosis protein 2-like protein [Leptotrombidium deliense]